ncbi:MAG: SprB repeat-containing protein [Bacteroidetes bacterium]|nr:SprB repeat-containing protein [Bacteroidota bacterium]
MHRNHIGNNYTTCCCNFTFNITQPVSCFGGNNGAINLTVTGGTAGYTYNWSNGFSGEDPSALIAGTYTVTVTDANGCTETTSATVTQPAATIGLLHQQHQLLALVETTDPSTLP